MIASVETQNAARAMQNYKHCKTAKPGRIQRHFSSLAARSARTRRTAAAQMKELLAQWRYMRQLEIQRARRARSTWWNAISERVLRLLKIRTLRERLEEARSEIVLHLKKLLEELSCALVPSACTAGAGGSGNGVSKFTNSGSDPPANAVTDFNNSNINSIEYMVKSLTQKLRTGAAIGLASLALGATAPKARADIVYDSGLKNVTNYVSYVDSENINREGNLVIDYHQTIEEVDTNNDGEKDSYLSKTYIKNRTLDASIPLVDKSFFVLSMNADLAGRGATSMTNHWASEGSVWNYEKKGENMGEMILTEGSWAMEPTFSDTFYYTISKDKVLGWENVGASMGANAGSVSFDFHAPVIPEPTTIGLLGAGALATLAGRRIKENYRKVS